MNPPLSPRKSQRKRHISSGSYVVESLPGKDSPSDFEEDNQEPGGTRTSKQPKTEHSTTACYPCAHDTKSKCQQLSGHLHDHGARLQAAALRIANNQPVESWDQLVAAASNAMGSGIGAKPEVAPRVQSSQSPALASAQTSPQAQLHPSVQSPPEVQGLPQPAGASQSPGDTMFQQILAELKQKNALSKEANQLLGEVASQQREQTELARERTKLVREQTELSQRQIVCLTRIIEEMNALNEGTEANLPPFE
ncbi:hypothetical protein DER45DRAFT_649117 [Fusarium avenaceum]|nr:hypothetical protein DER45DRAFT_649117 [Fusarium avenaceum]